ncbi:lanthionine synthetase LanC family protein [Streptomyces sp. CSDS2]|uniref:lanthionine synthetase LanC family protein n=1 Tax=Streptomyces sp. CSDS2 TaxID=3055051 RepID=UPI0025AFCE0F|nr:lanthionine synthetase LanC family protein [Streptomyces sp. CSDS2]MDN3258675.1 lanthionine synthetase LanC family protein [Streptomyces sp. CSDS2]
MPHDPAAPTAPPGEDVHGLAVRCLLEWAEAPDRGGHRCDPGIPVLAHLVADDRAAPAAVAVWSRTAGRGPSHPALYDGGLAGTFVGLRLGARVLPGLGAAADRLGAHLAGRPLRYRTREVAFPDYDLISGPSGLLLALYASSRPELPVPRPLAAHLALLCDEEGLGRLRAGQYTDHSLLAWMQGRVNTGMGHGVAGLVTALTTALRRTGPDPDLAGDLAGALRRATRWLVGQAYDDERGIRTWPGAGLAEPPSREANPRQAWCYGTPGVAWALWDAADALGDEAAADWAATAFTTLAEHYDETFHLFGDTPGDRLGLCHGAAGVLAVADAFDRHARLPAANALKDRLVGHLTSRLADRPLAEWPADLLTGLPGVLAALLTAVHGAPRGWLPCLGLR